ncbi:hypothetical protein FAI40_09275 [Acetobacteraceae bacterium]|nr:hypothetical protein FAI40_09275 [Acetobacteraceae bacterium]
MTKLTKAERDALPDSAFALPQKRMFPIFDRSHAKAALLDAPRALKDGSITEEEKEYIDRLAREKLAKKI